MNENKKASNSLFKGLLAVAVASAPSISAQDDVEEEIFELSPFTVDASNDTGYRANSTLAGTRLNTALKDVAASVTVVTEDFMNDIGATDMEGLLTYLGSTETGGMEGNFSAAGNEEADEDTDVHRSDARPQQSYRVRGLARADRTQNYFITETPLDSFNFEQMTINRGPNSALFGLGSAGGVMNASLKKAQFRDFTEVETKHDSYGTQRYVLDVNRQLLEDKLAIRIALLYNDKGYEQDNAYNMDRRQYGTFTFKPFENTTLRANFTNGYLDRSTPVSRPPRDDVSLWASLGKPLWDPVTGTFYASREAFAAGTPLSDEVADSFKDAYGKKFTNNDRRYYTVFFPDPDSPNAGGNGTPEFARVAFEEGKDYPNAPEVDDRYMIEWKNARAVWDQPAGSFNGNGLGLDPVVASFYKAPYIGDRSIYDYREQSVYGPNRLNINDFDSFSATLEQTFFENKAGFELSVYEESFRDDYLDFKGNLHIDTNLRFINGDPNPNVGRVYIGGNEYSEPQFSELESQRLTAFAEFDFADKGNDGWVSKLGRHVLTGLAGVQKSDKRTQTHKGTFLDPSILQFDRNKETLRRYKEGRTWRASYLGGPNQLDVPGAGIQGITGLNAQQLPPVTASSILTWDAAKAESLFDADEDYDYTEGFSYHSGVTVNNYLREPGLVFHGANTRTFSEIESLSSVLQSYFFEGNLVTAFSWREDTVDLARGQYNPDPVTRVTQLGNPPLDDFNSLGTISATSFSVVGHVPTSITESFLGDAELSFHYVSSNNTEARGGNVDLFGRALALPTGETEEYGFSFRSAEGKFNMRVNFYESSEVGSILGDVGDLHKIELNLLQFNTQEELAAAGYETLGSHFNDTWNITRDGDETDEIDNATGDGTVLLPVYEEARNPGHIQQFTTADTSSEGMEIELTYNPTNNWRIAMNVSKIEAVRSNLANAEGEYLDKRLNWMRSDAASGLWYDDKRWDKDEPDYENMLVNPETGKLHEDILESVAEVAYLNALDGFPVPELRKWRANFITNYIFGDESPSFLKGFNVGGAVRWEDKLAAGYGLKQDERTGWIQDLDNIYYAPAQTSLDLWLGYKRKFESGVEWKMRLGAKNVTSDEGLLDTKFNPDGSRGAIRIEPGRRYELSNSFSF